MLAAADPCRGSRRGLGPRSPPRFIDGMARLADGTELHLASLRVVDTSLSLPGEDHPAFKLAAALHLGLKEELIADA